MPTCFECGIERKSIAGHITGKHSMQLAQYRKKWGENVDLGPILNKKTAEEMKVQRAPLAQKAIVESFSNEEKRHYQDQFNLLYEQADRDPVLIPMIRDIVVNQIFISRYQLKIQQMAAKPAGFEVKAISELHKLVQTMQETNLKNLDSLNLTAAKKATLNKTPETTPSRVVSAFAYSIKLMTPEERLKNKKDMEDAMGRLRHNLDELLTLVDQNDESAEEIEPVVTE